MKTAEFVSGFITTDSLDSARKISQALLEKKLIACATLLDGAESHYWWNGELRQGEEIIIYIKTTASLAEAIELEVTNLHPYDCPCIVFAPLVHMNDDYADWLRVVLKSGKS